MRFDVVTIFPEFFAGPLDHGITRRARDAGIADVRIHDLRRWTRDRHRTVDDRPFGGGEGMVLKPAPLFEAVEEILGLPPVTAENPSGAAGPGGARVVLLSAAGKLFRQATARELARADRVVLLCGRYEGVDERVAERLATDELSIGDYVLSGGELAAAVVVEATLRLLPGALGNEDSAVNESFSAQAAEVSRQPSDGSTAPATTSLHARPAGALPAAAADSPPAATPDSPPAAAADSPPGTALDSSPGAALGSPPGVRSSGVAPASGQNFKSQISEQNLKSQVSEQDLKSQSSGQNLKSQMSDSGILDFPHYTRPQDFRGWTVPEVLTSGNHEEIRRWRRRKALEKTLRNRPDLLASVALGDDDRRLLAELQRQ